MMIYVFLAVIVVLIGAFAIYIIAKDRVYAPAPISNLKLHIGPFGNTIRRDNPNGLITYVKDSYGKEYWYKYDRYNRLIEYKDSEGKHFEYKYKNDTRLLKRAK